MSVFTSRLKLWKANLSDSPRVTDFDGNWDLLDQALLANKNLGDVGSVPTARLNLRVPTLSPAAAVVTTNVSALNTFQPVFDGVTLLSGMQVLLVGQTNAVQNGPWLVSKGPGIPWTRPADFAAGTKLGSRTIWVSAGSNGAGQTWMLATPTQITVDTDAQLWVKTSGAQGLSRTAVKTAAYTAVPGDYVPVDTTGGPVTVSLPAAPAYRCRVAVKHIIQGSTNAVTVACSGSGVLNKTGGSTSFTMPLVSQAAVLEYDPPTAIWTILTDDLPLSQLDLRYLWLSLFTTKGDLGVATGAGAVTRLGVGTDGYVLTADAAQTSGVKWAATSGGVPTSRVITAGTGLTGGGDLTADRTLAVSYGTTSGTAAQGNDSRFTTISTTTQSASYILALTDAGSCVESTAASAMNITVPPNSSVAFPINTIIELCQYGAGQITVVPGTGVTIRNPSSLTTRAQFSSVRLRKRATDEWVASGDLS